MTGSHEVRGSIPLSSTKSISRGPRSAASPIFFMHTFFSILILPISAYLLGAVPFGWILVRLVAGADIRKIGSGNIGTTNVRRTIGTKWALVTLICDILKGLLPTLAASSIGSGMHPWLPAVTALATICGHMYPIYFRFKPSGKGVATAMGSYIIVAPWACLCAVTAFLVAVRLSRRVSVGSLTGIFLLPPSAWFTSGDPFLTFITIVIMVLILSRHAENIQRLAQDKEPVLGAKRVYKI
jgi:glycerol-3-phosphate acyltransferase PlsY